MVEDDIQRRASMCNSYTPQYLLLLLLLLVHISRQQGLGHKQWQIQDFPEEGAPTPQGGTTYDFAIFSQKLHGIERIWAPRGRASLAPPPLRSATEKAQNLSNKK